MLVLSRRANETIVFPDLGITVEVIRIKGNTIRLGIKAPDSIRILRGELDSVVHEFEERSVPAMPIVSCMLAHPESNVA